MIFLVVDEVSKLQWDKGVMIYQCVMSTLRISIYVVLYVNIYNKGNERVKLYEYVDYV